MQLYRPSTELQGVVECAITVRRAAGSFSRFPAMPRAMLTLTRASGGAGAVAFHALSTRACTLTHAQALHALGLVLPPDTAARLLGPSTGALVDTTLPWAAVAGPSETARLDDALQECGPGALSVLPGAYDQAGASPQAPMATLIESRWSCTSLASRLPRNSSQSSALRPVGQQQVSSAASAPLGPRSRSIPFG